MTTPSPHVVVGTDGSEGADRAVRWAAREAALRGRTLRIVHAFIWPYLRVSTAPVPGMRGTGLRRIAEDLLLDAAAVARAASPGVRVVTDLPVGAPIGVLLAAADDAELVVIGSDGLGRLDGLIIGSVGVGLIAGSRGPVVVVTGPVAERTDERRVVAGVGGFDHRNGPAQISAVLDYTFRDATRRQATVTVVHATAGREEGQDGTAIRAAVAAWSDDYPHVDVRYVADRRTPAAALVARADGAELLVLGTHGWGGFAGLVHGSVGQDALRRAPCPVAVVHSGT
ncbi:universal stress protein [Cryptosporangium japonicum]|uniref:Universal stress protein n=1 Tax=Cryptosporangium japonicum TaxID=80872 RepID=A0ABN0TI60_9ACTN